MRINRHSTLWTGQFETTTKLFSDTEDGLNGFISIRFLNQCCCESCMQNSGENRRQCTLYITFTVATSPEKLHTVHIRGPLAQLICFVSQSYTKGYWLKMSQNYTRACASNKKMRCLVHVYFGANKFSQAQNRKVIRMRFSNVPIRYLIVMRSSKVRVFLPSQCHDIRTSHLELKINNSFFIIKEVIPASPAQTSARLWLDAFQVRSPAACLSYLLECEPVSGSMIWKWPRNDGIRTKFSRWGATATPVSSFILNSHF